MTDYRQILKVKEDAEARLRRLPGVHAVGISKKVVAGKPTGELCIAVFLVAKKPLDQLAPEAVVPPEIDGVKTDVVEMEVPRLTAGPSLVATVAPDQQSVTLSCPASPSGAVVMLLLTWGKTGGPDNLRPVHFEAQGVMTLNVIATKVAGLVTVAGVITATATGAQVALAPKPGFRAAITQCIATTADDKRYAGDYLRGGIQIEQGTSIGTLGCLATTAPTAADPHGKVVALTCHHVVGSFDRQGNTSLKADLPSAPDGTPGNDIDFSATPPIPPGTLVVVTINLDTPPGLKEVVLYTTITGDTAPGIAKSVALAITNLNVLALSATAVGQVVTVFGGTPSCQVSGPPIADAAATLRATVIHLDIDFTGDVSGDDYGIFVNINPGGELNPLSSVPSTFGVYTHPARGSTLSAIAQSVAKAINDLPVVPVRGPVTATASGARVTVSNAQEVECIIKSDCRIGQPSASFASSCSSCLNQRIGRVLDARLDLDTALIQLDAGQSYKPEIQDIGLVTGTYDLLPEDVKQLEVQKRGRTSGLTHGIVDAMNVSGEADDGSAFERLYTNAVSIAPKPGEVFFALPGDSGSAVLRDTRVVGILFLQAGRNGLLTPISQITTAFQSLVLNLAPAPEAGHAAGDVRVVPAAAMAAVAPLAEPQGTPTSFLGQRLAQVRSEVTATPAGSEVAAAVERHFTETHKLVTTNRRVAAVWRRSGGPQIVQAVLDLAQRRDKPLPEEIDGRPFAECLARIKSALARSASPALAADL
ncbi:MAG TPA: hypothetical protein VGK45_13840, partial [Thermoanaerobaculia bacterium]